MQTLHVHMKHGCIVYHLFSNTWQLIKLSLQKEKITCLLCLKFPKEIFLIEISSNPIARFLICEYYRNKTKKNLNVKKTNKTFTKYKIHDS